MFHPDLRLLRCFAAIADTGSVTRAAERLNLSQPTISGQIRELEQELGFPLFHRTSRSVMLSDKGAQLLPMVRDVLAKTETLRREVEELQVRQAQQFRLGAAMYSLDFAERIGLLEAFGQAEPDFRYAIDNRLQTDQIPELVNGKLDAALLLGIASGCWNDAPGAELPGMIVNETVYPSHLDRVVLGSRRIGLLVPEGSPLARMDEVPAAMLQDLEIVMLSAEHGHALVDPITDFLAHCGATIVQLSEGNALAIEREARRLGICAIGIGWFPTLPGLVFRPVADMAFSMEFALVCGSQPSRAARHFFAFAARWQAARAAVGDPVPALTRSQPAG
ncbi:MAG: hypothetical protein RIS94_1281 [Pseudomonadota bacterium]|jgi:DNA-binding transcriptional LysR family regulator